MQRIFIAITLPDTIQAEVGHLLVKLNKFSWPVKWESPEKLHLTLRFLGDIPGSDVLSVCQALDRIVKNLKQFELVIKGFVAFPDFKFPKVIGLKILENNDLLELQSLVSCTVNELGIGKQETHQFNGHITLGRLTPTYANFHALSQISFQSKLDVDSVAVMSSVLKPTGSEYTIIHRYQLAG
jgi:2'-5' RNA ligase